MGWIGAIWIIVLGILGASNLIIARKPAAREFIGKLMPYQGWIGAISALWGAFLTVWILVHVGWMRYSGLAVVFWFTILAEGLVLLSLGLILGVGVLKTFIKQPEATARMDMAVTRLAPLQGTLGLAAIGLGVWGIVASIIMRVG
jgi:hypothetical protein